jgi:hypothetical protein
LEARAFGGSFFGEEMIRLQAWPRYTPHDTQDGPHSIRGQHSQCAECTHAQMQAKQNGYCALTPPLLLQ